MVIHRDDGGVHLVITTFELKATKSRDRLSILGKVPVLATAFSWNFRTLLFTVPLEQSLFPSGEGEAEWPGCFAACFMYRVIECSVHVGPCVVLGFRSKFHAHTHGLFLCGWGTGLIFRGSG